MRTLLALATILTFGFGVFAASAIKSDVQLTIVLICFVGTAVLGGLLQVLSVQRRILDRLKKRETSV